MNPLTCPKCGHQASVETAACPECGHALNGQVPLLRKVRRKVPLRPAGIP